MEELLKQIAIAIEKDFWDYLGILTPILLSVIAILISIWNSFWSQNIKKIEANLVWDDLLNTFFIIIRNTGNKSIIIDTVSLIACNSKGGKKYLLGTRENSWIIKQEKGHINKNEVMIIAPIYDSIYDVFAYQGHAFDVTDENSSFEVLIEITDIDKKKWKDKTTFTLGEIDEKLKCAITYESNIK